MALLTSGQNQQFTNSYPPTSSDDENYDPMDIDMEVPLNVQQNIEYCSNDQADLIELTNNFASISLEDQVTNEGVLMSYTSEFARFVGRVKRSQVSTILPIDAKGPITVSVGAVLNIGKDDRR